MSNIYNESVHFVGPTGQIILIPAHLKFEASGKGAWLTVESDNGLNIGEIEEVTCDAYKISMHLRMHGSPMNTHFEGLSHTLPTILMMSSSCCPHMGDYYLEAWYGGKQRFFCCIPMFDNNYEPIPGVSTPENSILADFWVSLGEVRTAAQSSFAEGRKTPRKAMRILEQMKTRWDAFDLPEPKENQKAS